MRRKGFLKSCHQSFVLVRRLGELAVELLKLRLRFRKELLELEPLCLQVLLAKRPLEKLYTKVLSKFAASKGLKLTVKFELSSDGAISQQKIEEAKVALRELGLDDSLSNS